ncbi:MAG TPA: hypothetical protein EYG93_02965 [Sulfurospirillum arcachonense]|nr:hypothetical protein [Sulfurospirillum arcachonense]HIP44283.1 hypothetical protein [Sulfurospirillum arcachonense]
MLLTPEVIAILILDTIFLLFACFAFYISIPIALKWDINSTSAFQYGLEKKAILVATIIKYIFVLKLPLFLFFIFTSDKISGVITGAMCAAGVVNSVDFGLSLFIFKILNLYIFGFWLFLHTEDMKDEKLKFTKLKFTIFIVAFLLLITEIFYEISFFTSLDVDKIVSCCGTLFSAASTSTISFIFDISNPVIVTAFYITFALYLITFFLKKESLFLASNILFFIVSVLSLILFFGTYIYELPTHHCPFCFLQKDYYYVGYALYITLFIGTFIGISGSILSILKPEFSQNYYRTSLIFNILYTLIVSVYPVVFYIRNGVWL